MYYKGNKKCYIALVLILIDQVLADSIDIQSILSKSIYVRMSAKVLYILYIKSVTTLLL